MGFQSGAIVYAQKYGIQLMEIRHPIDKDWEGRIKNIHLDLCLRTIGEIRPQIFVNKTRVAELGIAPPENKEFNKLTDQVRIDFDKTVVDKKTVDEKNSKTVYELIQKLPVSNPGRGNKFVFAFQMLRFIWKIWTFLWTVLNSHMIPTNPPSTLPSMARTLSWR